MFQLFAARQRGMDRLGADGSDGVADLGAVMSRDRRAESGLARAASALARPLVVTNGVFDILHRGHATYLARARALGASLLVALNSDASARRLGKGPDRPINALEDRMAVVPALEPIDLVTWVDEAPPAAVIRACRPDVLATGGGWPVVHIVGADEVRARGDLADSRPVDRQC